MAASKREWRQVEMKLTAGAEPWLLLRHRTGAFWLPCDAAAGEIYRGVTDGWCTSIRDGKRAPGYVKVPLDQWLRLTMAEGHQ